jgi:DNA modification methylase
VIAEQIPISSIKLNPNNPRLVKDDKFKKLVKSIQDFPQMLNIRPIVVNDDMIVLGGNMRLKACKEAGLKEVPVIKAGDLTEEQQREFIIKDNVGFGEWDWEMIANEWDAEQVTDWGLDIPDFTPNVLEAEEDDFEIPDTITTDIVLGDLFEIGQHRLLCGSSTEADAVAKLFYGCKPVLMITDPPYGVSYDPNWRKEHNETKGFAAKTVQTGKVLNDDQADWTAAYSLFTGDVAYVWHGGKHSAEVAKNLQDCGFEIAYQIIWNKMHGVFGRGDYHWQHEPCWYAVRKGSKHNWQGSRKETTVWDIKGFNPNGSDLAKREEKTGHGTQKPVECMARPIRNNTFERQTVYDPFLGSGTSMVAAHQLNRMCLGMELNPSYVQITINRLLKLDPSLEIKRNGQPYKPKSDA